MMTSRSVLSHVLGAIIAAAMFGPVRWAHAAEATPGSEPIAADSAHATPAGTTFTAPAGWSLATRGAMIVLTAPEADTRLAIVDMPMANADAAVDAAWAAFDAAAKPPLRLAVAQAARNGWEERRRYDYETSPNERRTVFAAALRQGSTWTVFIVAAADATFGKRSSQVSLLLQSLRPAGYQRESFAGRRAQPLDAQRIATLKAFVADGMAQLGVPGVAIGLIDGGRVVFEGGVGVKQLGKPEPIDARTLFIAASNTKALTTLLLAELADEKKLRWDQPVTELYPAFKLGDAATTKQVLVKHLVCACTGLPRQDMEWLFEYRRATPASAMQLLGTMQPTSGFGQLFQYSNLMAAAAGYVGAALVEPKAELGAAYDRAMRRKVFLPLGMNDTTFDYAQAQRGNHASPHGLDVDGKPALARMDLNYAIVPARPAGGVWTSAHDLSRYVQMELARGKRDDGGTLVSEENLLARRAPQVMVGEDISYGMGLFVDRSWGIPVVSHGGDLAGYHSNMYWLPEHGIGAVILTNGDPGTALRGPFIRKLVELLFDGKPEADAQLAASAAQMKAAIAKERSRLTVPADAAPARALAPRYASDALGTLTVRRDKAGALVFDAGEWRSAVASRKNDDGSTSFITIDPTLAGFEFVVGEREGRRALMLHDAQHEYIFVEAGS
jgi:CubicO group peptidase (beta-lactamase class C family)